MKQTSYRDRDYPFGQIMLSLRSAIGFTQAGLADTLGVSRRSVVDWEAGNKYPKVEHLKQLIVLALQAGAFPEGREAEEVRFLWQAAHQKVLLDEGWLGSLLGEPTSAKVKAVTNEFATRTTRLDWGDALSVPSFYGREAEQRLLSEWMIAERCRVVNLVGFGGIGKSTLAVNQMHQVAEDFEVVIWRSLRDAPACDVLIDDTLQTLEPESLAQHPENLEQRLSLLLERLRDQRVLLVLDNLEALLEEGENVGQMRAGYEGYGRMLRQIAETKHQSCLLLTSREKAVDLAPLEGSHAPVRTLRLTPLDAHSCGQLLSEKDVAGNDAERAQLIEMYTGNPLALKIVAQTLVDLFDGEIAPFLEQGEAIFGGVRDLLNQQFIRLSPLEQSIVFWLAIVREPATLDVLMSVLMTPTSRARLLEAIDALSRRSLIERGQVRASFTLQSVVLEYVTARLIAEASEEIERGRFVRLVEHGLELAQSREYVRQTQERLIVVPILGALRSSTSQQAELEALLEARLTRLRSQSDSRQGYGAANLLVLLRLLRGHLRGLDLSALAIRGAYLQGVDMQDTSLNNATIQDCVFTETFDAMGCVAVSPQGDYWAAASRRGEIRIWEAGGRQLLQAWRGHADMIWGLRFSPDGLLLASSSWDGMVKLWEVPSGQLLWSGRHTSFANSVAFSVDGRILASSGNDSLVQIWDVASGALLQTLPHPSPVPIVIWTHEGNLISGDVEGIIRVWAMNLPEPTVITRMEHAPKGYVDGLSLSPDGQILASASWDATVRLWEMPEGRLLHTLTGHPDRVGRVVWSPDGRTIATSGYGEIILLWDVEQAQYRATLQGHSEDVYQLAFTPDSRTLLSVSRDATLRVWDMVSEQCVSIIQGYATSIYDADWSPDSAQLISGSSDRRVTFWDVKTRQPFQSLQEHLGIVVSVGWSPNGRWIASTETEHDVRLWDLTAGTDFRRLRPPELSGNYSYGVAWNPDGQRLASGSPDWGVVIWDVATGEERWIGQELAIWFPHIAWSPDGRHLAGGGHDGIIYIWNVAENVLEQQLIGQHSMAKSLAWSPDGTRLASGSGSPEGGELFVWDVVRGEWLHNLSGHEGSVTAVGWGANSEQVISGGGDGTIRWWDAQTGERLRIREAHQGTVQALRRSPDATTLASCGDDGTIVLWDLRSGDYLQTLRRDRPYERMNITGIAGLSEGQKTTLLALGAVER
ncbi:MAG: XRE family transcriptional regulator [Chloroflexi bacterium]|nr:XRE family transcriptional regulator [Chloroflexota bacterium]